MRFGLAVMNDFPPGTVAAERLPLLKEQVRAAKSARIDSIWVLQHYLGSMPTLQPLPLLSALAEHAGDMHLGTNMFILPLRHPVGVAEEFATLDHLTGGRAIAGFGMGYRENEFAAFGVPLEERVTRFEESVQIVRGLWSGEPVTFQGKHFQIDGERISLKPRGEMPVFIGAGPHTTGAKRAARLGDAWLVPPHVPLDRLRELAAVYHADNEKGQLVIRRELVLDEDRDRARAIGVKARGDLTSQYAQYNAPQAGAAYQHLAGAKQAEETADASYLFTDPEGAVAALRELQEAGVAHVVLRAQWFGLGQEQVLRTLELFDREVRPRMREETP